MEPSQEHTACCHHHEHEDDHGHAHDHDHAFEWPEMVRIALVAADAAGVWFHVWEPLTHLSVIGVVGLLIGGVAAAPFGAIVVRHLSPKIMLILVGIAAGGNYVSWPAQRHKDAKIRSTAYIFACATVWISGRDWGRTSLNAPAYS